jgi:hypothetical protein
MPYTSIPEQPSSSLLITITNNLISIWKEWAWTICCQVRHCPASFYFEMNALKIPGMMLDSGDTGGRLCCPRLFPEDGDWRIITWLHFNPDIDTLCSNPPPTQ